MSGSLASLQKKLSFVLRIDGEVNSYDFPGAANVHQDDTVSIGTSVELCRRSRIIVSEQPEAPRDPGGFLIDFSLFIATGREELDVVDVRCTERDTVPVDSPLPTDGTSSSWLSRTQCIRRSLREVN